jgi:hypothetical protein
MYFKPNYLQKNFLPFILLGMLLTACIEPYDFRVEDVKPTLVVEGFISDASFNDTYAYPSDGRYFSINLSYTNDVINIRGSNVVGAQINIVDDLGGSWSYTEINEDPPRYLLLDDNFKAIEDRSYQLKIKLSNGDSYESEWTGLPEAEVAEIGDIDFIEDESLGLDYISGEEVIRNIQGMRATINLPPNNTEEAIYYKWSYDPTWIYKTPLPTYRLNSVDVCWAKNKLYLNTFDMVEDYTGGYIQNLFYMRTDGNERIYDKISVLITQQVMQKDHYFFYKELKDRASTGIIFDQLPFNLPSNIKALDNTKQVFGFFGVVKEQAKRWYFDKDELSYYVINNLAENCIKYATGTPAAECISCLDYSHGKAVAEEPYWWNPQ